MIQVKKYCISHAPTITNTINYSTKKQYKKEEKKK